jgi:hypothetical protein
MSSSVELLRTWVHETLGQLADDDDQHAKLRDTSDLRNAAPHSSGPPLTHTEEVRGSNPLTSTPPLMTSGNVDHQGPSCPGCCCPADGERLTPPPSEPEHPRTRRHAPSLHTVCPTG